jgi:hypothetical protein
VNRRRFALALLLVCLAVAGCSGSVTGSGNGKKTEKGKLAQQSKTVDAAKLEMAIATAAEAQRHEKATVICPSGLITTPGAHFYCAAQAGGEVTPFLVNEGAAGKLSYNGVSPDKTPSVNMAQTEIAIAQAMKRDHETARSVSCPQEMPRQQGLEFVCVATTAAKRPTDFLVHETNSLGHVSFAVTDPARDRAVGSAA